MTQTSLPTYTELSDALSNTALKLHASQAHGLVCGVIVGHVDHNKALPAWQNVVTGDEQPGDQQALLQLLFDCGLKQLQEFLFEFQLLLPDDAQELPARAEALSLWCQGFLIGLKLSNVQIADREPSEVTEALNDLIEISRINYEEVVDNEEDEAAYAEFVEYVRMAVILIYQELREEETEAGSSTQPSGNIH